MLASLLSTPIIGAILRPIVDGLLSGYKAKLENQTSREAIAADLAQRELAVQEKEIAAQTELRIAQIGHPFEPSNLAAYIFVLYVGKVVVWDTMLGLGSTPAIKGDVGNWMGMIAMFLFGKRGIENVARILKK